MHVTVTKYDIKMLNIIISIQYNIMASLYNIIGTMLVHSLIIAICMQAFISLMKQSKTS